MSGWTAVVLAGLGSFALRFAIVAVIDRWQMPPWLEQLSGYVMPASFAGLCAAALLAPRVGGSGGALAAALVTGTVATRRSPSVALLGGMCTLWGVAVLEHVW